MLFKKLELHGFKSFAEPVTIEFHEGITGIIGPNGSGKSNISDAIRWVLGEQSPKMLRGDKMEEVIFNGTSSRKSRGMADVTLVINNEDGTLPIDYKEVVINRKMYRSGESEYAINGSRCRLRDIRNLIVDTGIGVEGYSLIGQGRISDIISNKTESRRQIFEEAAGIVAYRTRKAQAERKLEATAGNMERLRDVMDEIEQRLPALSRDSENAKKYLGLRDRYKELEINIILKNIENIELKNEYTKDDLSEIQLSIENLTEEKNENEKQISDANTRNERLEELSSKARNQLIKIIEELNNAEKKQELERERLHSCERDKSRLESEINDLEEKKQRESAGSRSLKKEKETADREKESARELLKTRTEEYNRMHSRAESLSEEANDYEERIFSLQSDINSANAEIKSLEMLGDTLTRREEALNNDKAAGKENTRDIIDIINTLRREKKQLEDEINDKKNTLSAGSASLDKIKEEESRLIKQSAELNILTGRLSSRMKTFEEMESNYEGYNNAVRHVMRSGIPGIHGVFAELIETPAGYETAVETALGGSLQNIVCEDDASAKKAIRSLKENRAGRMTFLPVASIRGSRTNVQGVEREKGFIGYGSDCIKFDEKYRDITEYLLGRVIVADNIDNAIRISHLRRGIRVVTLDGEIVNSAGAITGGRYKNKTANILGRKREISDLKKEIHEKEEENAHINARLNVLRENSGVISEKIKDTEEQISSKEQESIIKDSEINAREAALLDIKENSARADKELENIAREKKKSLCMTVNLQKRIAEAKGGIETARAEGGAKLDEYEQTRQEIEELSEEITKARITVTDCENRQKHAQSMYDRVRRTIEDIDEDIASDKLELADIKRRTEELLAQSGETIHLISEKKEARINAEEYLTDIQDEKTQLSSATAGLSESREEIDNKIADLSSRKYELELKKTRNETQLDNYKEKLWDDFEVSYIQAMDFKSEEFVMSSALKESRQLKKEIKALGDVNVGAIKEYETVKGRYDFLSGQRDDVQSAMESLEKIISDMDKTIRKKFKESFNNIEQNFEIQFKSLFDGGHAELRLSDENDPLQAEIDIIAQPPGKKLQNINLLSGGEKTLTAIALMFAVLQVKPTPFCILDEVEAALDDANIDRFIRCLRRFKGIQFALVTHQKTTMEHADVLYGVTMPEKGVSKVLSLNFAGQADEILNS